MNRALGSKILAHIQQVVPKMIAACHLLVHTMVSPEPLLALQARCMRHSARRTVTVCSPGSPPDSPAIDLKRALVVSLFECGRKFGEAQDRETACT